MIMQNLTLDEFDALATIMYQLDELFGQICNSFGNCISCKDMDDIINSAINLAKRILPGGYENA